jgi:ketol-acid reductoisomerase
MPAKMYYDKDANPEIIRGKKVAVLGYGSQGHAHALNLQDNGVAVKVGLAPGSKSREKAKAAGLSVGDVGEVTKWADVIMVLVPDTAAAPLYRDEIAPPEPRQDGHVRAWLQIRFGFVAPPDVDVTMIAPKSPGHRVPRCCRGRHAGAAGVGTGRHQPARVSRCHRVGHRRHAPGS